jgi:uncharacterized membrane protein YhhN
MKLSIKNYIAVAVLFFIAILFSKTANCESITKYLIPVFVAFVFVHAVAYNLPLTKNHKFLLLAFGFVCIGDFMINLSSYGKYSVLAFCCTHICLTIYYFSDNKFKLVNLTYLITVLLFSAALFLIINKNIDEVYLSIVFGAYLTVLSVMLWRALCYLQSENRFVRKFLIISGSLLFFITDICVSANVVYNSKTLIIITWICYPPALVMLSLTNTVKQTQSVRQG